MSNSKEIDNDLLNEAMVRYEKEAEVCRDDAGYGGRRDDGGFSMMTAILAAYKAGRNGVVPDFLLKHYVAAKNARDPDYVLYQKLKEKFES